MPPKMQLEVLSKLTFPAKELIKQNVEKVFLKELKGHKKWVRALCFSPDGSKLATGSADWKVGIWDLQTRKNIYTKKDISRYNLFVLAQMVQRLPQVGEGELRRDQLLKGQLTLKNMSNYTQVYTIRVAMDDDVVNHFEEEIPRSMEVGAHSAQTFPVVFKVKKEIPEKVIDGVLIIQGDSDTLRVPFIIVSGNPSTFPQQDNNG